MTFLITSETELTTQENNYLDIVCRYSNLMKSNAINLSCTTNSSFSPGFFEVSIEHRSNISLDLEYADFTGFRNAINSVRRALLKDITFNGKLNKSPNFEHRGLIEGFYGDPWTIEERLEMLKFLAVHDFNLFVIAPKDDPWQRFEWRRPFEDKQIKHFAELQSVAAEFGINLSVCVSPGLSIEYTNKEDLQAIINKLGQLNQIGISTFGLLLDDIPPKLRFQTDIDEFKTIAKAHSFLGNQVFEKIQEMNNQAALIFCPLEYHGRGNEDYIVALSSELNKDINLFWTGRQICSEYLDVFDAQVFEQNCNRKPFYWDNYPVNDVAMLHQLHVGPIEKRQPELHIYSAGYCCNPMDRIEASKFALASIGEFLVDPQNYHSDSVWRSYIADTCENKREQEALTIFLQACFESCLSVDPAPVFNEWLSEFSYAWHSRLLTQAIDLMQMQSEIILSAHSVINSSEFSNQKLRLEIMKWLTKFANTGIALKEIRKILMNVEINDSKMLVKNHVLSNQIIEQKEFLAGDPTRIFGDGLDMMLGELAAELAEARN